MSRYGSCQRCGAGLLLGEGPDRRREYRKSHDDSKRKVSNLCWPCGRGGRGR